MADTDFNEKCGEMDGEQSLDFTTYAQCFIF